MKNILFVDDEPQILKAMNRLLIQDDFNIYMATGALEALEIMGNIKIDLMVTDMRMPNIDGYELLKRAKAKFPEVIRLIVSGYADEKLVYKALEGGYAKMYILKPWDNDAFRNLIIQMLETKEILESKNIFSVINLSEKVPTMPQIYRKLLTLIDEDAGMDDIAKAIEQDQSTAARVLHLANTAFFGAKTGSIKQATMYLGLSNLKNLVLTSSIFEMNNIDGGIKSFNKDKLWLHTNLTNCFVNDIYEKLLKKKLKEISATAGLLHDIGMVILMNLYPEKYRNIYKFVKIEKTMTLEEAEKKLLGVTHSEVGGYLLNWWELPHNIVEAAMYHRDPFSEHVINKELVTVVYLADSLSWKIVDPDIEEEIDIKALEVLNISLDDWQAFLNEADYRM